MSKEHKERASGKEQTQATETASAHSASDKAQRIKGRNVTIDNAKGLLVLLFMIVHAVRSIPKNFPLSDWFYHSPPALIKWWGFNLLDLAPVAFFFFIGFVVYDAFEKRYLHSGRAAYREFFLKNMAIMGLFLCLIFVQNNLSGGTTQWAYFVSIGFTGFLMLPFLHPRIRKSTAAKFICAAAVFVFYYFMRGLLFKFLAPAPGNEGYGNSGGGPAACFGFLGVVLLAAGLGDIAKKKLWLYAVFTAAIYLLGLATTLVLKPDYQTFNVEYLFGAFSKFNLIYFIFLLFNKYVLKGKAIPFIATLGRNILLYLIITLLLISALGLFGFAPTDLKGVIIRVAVFAAAYALISIPLAKKKTLFKL
ncbi:MAG: hypothetical protein LBT30_07810 [Clostridiales bacterium]|jgi:hypothetical protein|nr:hypothetical protein [Clostridiales bacterium]